MREAIFRERATDLERLSKRQGELCSGHKGIESVVQEALLHVIEIRRLLVGHDEIQPKITCLVGARKRIP